MSTPRKPRAQRRAEGRQDAKDIRDRERLALLETGGSPERPFEVVTAALVEPKARALPCPICGGVVKLEDHTASTLRGVPERLAHVACTVCGHARVIYFVIRPLLPN
jgi:hypothetical protein